MTATVDQARVALDLVFAGTGLFVAALFASGLIGAALSRRRHRSAVAGAALGVLFGPVGWLIIIARGERIGSVPNVGSPVGDAVEAAGRHANAAANKIAQLAGRGPRSPGGPDGDVAGKPEVDLLKGWELEDD